MKKAHAAVRESNRRLRASGMESRMREDAKAERALEREGARAIRKAKSAQKLLAFDKIYEDGICEIRPGLYSRTISFGDIGYQTAREDQQKLLLNHLCYLINSCDDTCHLQLTLQNAPVPLDEFVENISLPRVEGRNGEYVDEYNKMIRDRCSEQSHTLSQSRAYTVSVHAESLERARKQLGTVCNSIEEQLRACGATYERLDGLERVRMLHGMLRPGENFGFDYEDAFFHRETVKDHVCPHAFDFRPVRDSGVFRFGDKHGQIMFLRKYPAKAVDTFLPALLDLSLPMSVSVHYQSMDDDEAELKVQRKYAYMDQQRAHEAKQAVMQGLDPSFVSSELLRNMDEAAELLRELRSTEQKLLYVTIYFFLWADTEEALEESVYEVTKAVNKTASARDIRLASQKKLAFNACLPIGCDYTDIARRMTTTEAALMSIPFAQVRMSERGGVYYGVNADSGEVVVANRKNLGAPHGWVLAKPSRGKSFMVKRELFATLCQNPYDEVLIIDPQGEYSYCVEAFGGHAYDISPNTTTYINPFDMDELYGGEGANPIAFKSSFIITMVSLLVGGNEGIDSVAQGIVDRCVRQTYAGYRSGMGVDDMPTLMDFYAILKAQDEPEAKYLTKALELYVEGSLSVFTHRTNLVPETRLRSYNTRSLPDALKTLGMLVVLDQVNNRAAYNFSRGVRTWLYIDEAQNYFENPHSIDYFDKTFSEGRKNLVVPTAITQNVDRILKHDKAIQMLSNSDYAFLLGQSKNDLDLLVDIYELSPKEREHLMNDTPGQGILVAGNRHVCVKDSFPKKTKLYELFSTDANEREEAFLRKRLKGSRTAGPEGDNNASSLDADISA